MMEKMPDRTEKINILGVDISAINMDDALQRLEHQIMTKTKSYVCVCPNHTIMESQKDMRLRGIVNLANIATPDGMSVVWACRLLGYTSVKQVCGTELMLALSALSAEKGYTHFYYGGANGVPEKLAENLCQRFPGLKVVGTYSPPFRTLAEAEDKAVVEMINRANPDVIWVGLGMPKQELWMGEHFRRIDATLMIGVGAAFDFLSGRKERSPKWMQRAGLEWLFRLVQEPKRLWRRNLYHSVFLCKVILQRVGIKHF